MKLALTYYVDAPAAVIAPALPRAVAVGLADLGRHVAADEVAARTTLTSHSITLGDDLPLPGTTLELDDRVTIDGAPSALTAVRIELPWDDRTSADLRVALNFGTAVADELIAIGIEALVVAN